MNRLLQAPPAEPPAGISGHLHLVGARRSDGRTIVARQSCRVPYHVSKPYWDADAGVLLVQVVNPTAGILAGDRLESEIVVESGAALLLTTPSASRVFRMPKGAATCRQEFRVAGGGWLEVLPEPLVPHRGSSFHQTTRIDVERGGAAFYVDILHPGRVAHGEAWDWKELGLALEARWDGALILRERLDQSGEALFRLAKLAGSGPAACFGNAVLIAGEEADDTGWTKAVAALHGDGLWLGISRLRSAGWSIKLAARTGAQLRQALSDLRGILTNAFPRLAANPRKL